MIYSWVKWRKGAARNGAHPTASDHDWGRSSGTATRVIETNRSSLSDLEVEAKPIYQLMALPQRGSPLPIPPINR